ncbi:MAG: hypothetical protein K6C34_01035 [Alphaproteobacteria bacterium]|nr:hypothetical protein [Alphaproteobacteria bacterium]
MKFEIQTEFKGKIIDISKSYNEKTHDFKIRKMSSDQLQKLHTKTVLPYQRRRKVPFAPEQKAHNTSLSSKRILVKHVFAQLKKFKILGSKYRNFRKKLHLRFNIIAGIYNLRFA